MLVLVRLFPECTVWVVFLDLGSDEAEVLSGEAELSNISLVPVLKLIGMEQGGLVAAKRGLLLGVLLWMRGLVMRARGAS